MTSLGGDWTCHACGATRPDEMISVASRTARWRGVEMTANVRYCNDRRECEGRARVIAEERAKKWAAGA